MAQKVVYTVLTGGYDRLAQPEVTAPGWDYICFTDREGRDGVWQLRPIPYEGSPVLRARWAKLHPHLLLPDYQQSVFMDANLCITGPEVYQEERLAVLPHPQRDCVWEELRYCYLKDKVSTRTAVRWHRFLRRMHMPRHAGLAETNILVRAHNQPQVVALDQRWWELLLSSGGSRDQLCLTPALHQLGMDVPPWIFGPGRNARNVACVRYENHPATGRENVPGKLNWSNVKYRLRLGWRQLVLLCLR